MRSFWCVVLLRAAAALVGPPPRAGRAASPRRAVRSPRRAVRRGAVAGAFETGAAVAGETYETFEHDGWSCAYRHKPGCSPAVVLVHPVGLGLSSWYWTRVAAELPNEVYMPDLIGCGRSQAWDPAERGLFLPLDYSRQIEALWRERIGAPCVVAVQGGLAPVGVLLASRSSDRWDGERAVAGLALASPPTWDEIAGGLDKKEVARNFDFLTSAPGLFLFDLLRSEFFIRFFSDAFLFLEKCEPEWVANCLVDDARPKSREPVLAFNAGVVGARGLYDELATLTPQPVLIIEGAGDKRQADRVGYETTLPDCARVSVEGACNVCGWEQPEETASAIAALVARARKAGRLDE